MNGIKTTMNIEQVSPNHFKFVDEVKPPDKEMDSMDISVANKENVSEEVHMQEDKEVPLEGPTSTQSHG